MENGNLSIMPVMMQQTGDADFRPAKDKELMADNYIFPTTGLTKREHFAGLIMQGLVANNFTPQGFQNGDEKSLAELAVKCSDAILGALEKK